MNPKIIRKNHTERMWKNPEGADQHTKESENTTESREKVFEDSKNEQNAKIGRMWELKNFKYRQNFEKEKKIRENSTKFREN